MEEAADFQGRCGVVDDAAVDGEAGVRDEDFDVGGETPVWGALVGGSSVC